MPIERRLQSCLVHQAMLVGTTERLSMAVATLSLSLALSCSLLLLLLSGYLVGVLVTKTVGFLDAPLGTVGAIVGVAVLPVVGENCEGKERTGEDG